MYMITCCYPHGRRLASFAVRWCCLFVLPRMIEYISSHFQSSLFLIHEAFPRSHFDCADYRKMSDSEDEQEAQQPEDPADGSYSESDDSAALAGDIAKVWDGGKMIQTVDGEGKKIMKCLHGDCGGEWRNWNHTKALGHVLWGSAATSSSANMSLNGGRRSMRPSGLGRCRESKTNWMLSPNSTWVVMS